MTTIYLMRHGQTYFNLWHKIQGWTDSPLTEEGIKQAKKLDDILEKIILILIKAIVQLPKEHQILWNWQLIINYPIEG